MATVDPQQLFRLERARIGGYVHNRGRQQYVLCRPELQQPRNSSGRIVLACDAARGPHGGRFREQLHRQRCKWQSREWSGDTTGSVFFATRLGAETFDYVHIISSVSSENDWIGASGGLWSTSSNWSLSSGTSTHRVPGFHRYGNLRQSVRQPRGRGGRHGQRQRHPECRFAGVQLRQFLHAPDDDRHDGPAEPGKRRNITINAGLHTIAVPLALSGSLTVDAEGNGSAGLTISGSISGTSSLIKTGPGTLWLSNTNNTYNGSTQVNGGTLTAAAPGSLGASGTVSISNATLDFTGSGTFARSIVLSGSGQTPSRPIAACLPSAGRSAARAV